MARQQAITLKYFCLTMFLLGGTIHALASIKDSIEVNQKVRVFNYTVPEKIDANTNIVLLLHGSGMNADFMEQVVGKEFYKQTMKSNNTILVYPEGYKGNWNDCRKTATYPAKKENIDDVQFLFKIIKSLKTKYTIHQPKIFVVGYSNGGHMAYKLAKQYPNKFEGFAVVGASLPVLTNDDCQSSNKPVSMMMVFGTSDPINPFNGGEVLAKDGKSRGKVMSASQSLEYWLSLVKGDVIEEPTLNYPDVNPQDNSRAIQYNYVAQKENKNIVFLKIINGGHHFANPSFNQWPEYLGNLNQDINLPKIIMDFFTSISK